MRNHPQFKAYLALACVCIFWGTTYLGIRVALESFSPVALMAIRYTISGGVMLIVVVAFFKSTPLAGRIAIGLLYGVAFVPLTYWIDRIAYRSYLKRSGKSGA